MPALRAVAYYRKSNEDDGGSIEQQREWAHAAAARENVELVAEFADQAKKGHETATRTAFLDMLAFCQEQARKRNPIRAVVCWHTNRFSRADSIETGHYLHMFRQAGIGRMLTAQKWIDFARGEDRIIFGVNQEAGDHQYVIDLAEAVLRGKLAAAREGRWNGGIANYGYRLAYDGVGPARRPRLVLFEEEAAIVREMFRAYAAGETSLYRLARDLNARGVKPRRAAKWTPTSVRSILVNEVYLGAYVWNKTEQGKFFGVVDLKLTAKQGVRNTPHPCARRPAADHVRNEDHHEAIVDRDTFEAVRRRLAESRHGRHRADRAEYALRGLLRCGVCGKSMVGKRAERIDRALMYRCGTYNAHGPAGGCGPCAVFEKPLIVAIGRKLQTELLNESKLAELRQEMLDALAGERPEAREVERLRRELAGLGEKLATASERFLTEKDATAAEVHRGTFNQLLARKQAIEAQVKQAELHKADAPDVDALITRAMGYARALDKALTRMKAADLRAVLRDLLDRVELFFRTEGGKEVFVRGFIYVKAGLLPDVNSAACHDPEPCGPACPPPCRPDTSSNPR
jgi:DNA invertase Pin-like site-specific DNA recombinase